MSRDGGAEGTRLMDATTGDAVAKFGASLSRPHVHVDPLGSLARPGPGLCCRRNGGEVSRKGGGHGRMEAPRCRGVISWGLLGVEPAGSKWVGCERMQESVRLSTAS